MHTFPQVLRFWPPLLLLLAIAVGAPHARAEGEQRVGVNAAVNTDANGTPPGGVTKRLVLGENIVHNERVTTDKNGQTQILFLDGSSVSVGPESDMTIDDFVYDPASGTGKMSLTDLQGAMRFVGGKLSKQEDAVAVHFGSATIGVRGGVFLADLHPGGKSQIIFVYGHGVTITLPNGQTVELYRPGFAIDFDSHGMIGSPHRAPPGGILAQLDGRKGGSGGVNNIPNDGDVANSNVPNTVSNDTDSSTQQADANSKNSKYNPPPPNSWPPQVSEQQTQTASNPPPPPPPQQSPAPQQQQPSPPSPPPPNVITGISGGINYDPGRGSNHDLAVNTQNDLAAVGPGDDEHHRHHHDRTLGFPGQPVPFKNATITNGVLVVTIGDLTGSIPLSPGTHKIDGTATYSPVGPLKGTVYEAADGSFFYADLTPVDHPSSTVFVYGGTPVSSSVFQPGSTPQILAFQIEPDAVLKNLLPFIPNIGKLSNPTVSPLYIEIPAATSITAARGGTPEPAVLQASLVFNGRGASQQSALVVAVGNIVSTTSNPNNPLLSGNVEGVYEPGYGRAPTLINSSLLTTIDGTGGSFYGNTSISGFVLDPNECCTRSGDPRTQLASLTNVQTGQNTNFNFNQPAVATTVPTAVANAPQTTQTLTGFFGGIMTPYVKGREEAPYAVVGRTTIQTNAQELEIAATLQGHDPFSTSWGNQNDHNDHGDRSLSAIGPGNNNNNNKNRNAVSAFELSFGNQAGKQGYINDDLFAAEANSNGTQQLNRQDKGTATAYLVDQNVVAGAIDSILPRGVTPCTCQYLQWGYWGGDLTTSKGYRNDVGGINTWVAGVQTPVNQMPTMGYGSYSGAAIGTVDNNGKIYVAAGGFNLNYNFGNDTGRIGITNFDGLNFGGTVRGGGNGYTGSLSGRNLNGTVAGAFFGPAAQNTGGDFAIESTKGPNYIASGIFAGALTGPIHGGHY
ncbi:MAG TPA: FecR family protein [Stellaceae bacterium]|nr:FecR family protein [Stellaceae bacterium]